MLFTTGFRSGIGCLRVSPGAIFEYPEDGGCLALKNLYDGEAIYSCYNESLTVYTSFYYKFQRSNNLTNKIPVCEVASHNRYRTEWYNYGYKFWAGCRWYVSLSGQLFGEVVCQYDKWGKDLIEQVQPPWSNVTTLRMVSLHTLQPIQENTWYHFNICTNTTCSNKIIIPGKNPYHTVTSVVSIKVNGISILLYPYNNYSANLSANISSTDGDQQVSMFGYPFYLTLKGNITTKAFFKDLAISDTEQSEGYSIG